MTVKWGSIHSHVIPLLSGVRQGGILSPLLFSLFVDSVLTQLEQSSLGCFVNTVCYNSFMYADDLILISITVTDLQHLLSLCSIAFSNLDLPININKCQSLRIGPRSNTPCSSLSIDGQSISWVPEIKFLGICIRHGKSFKCDWSETKKKFYCNVITQF